MNTLNLVRAAAVAVVVTGAVAGGLSACSKTASPPKAADTVAATPAPAPALATSGLANRLCTVLRAKAPELRGMPEVGARAQLVMAIASAFDADARALGTVSSDIDAIAAAGCPEVREPLLAATHAASLQEAVR